MAAPQEGVTASSGRLVASGEEPVTSRLLFAVTDSVAVRLSSNCTLSDLLKKLAKPLRTSSQDIHLTFAEDGVSISIEDDDDLADAKASAAGRRVSLTLTQAPVSLARTSSVATLEAQLAELRNKIVNSGGDASAINIGLGGGSNIPSAPPAADALKAKIGAERLAALQAVATGIHTKEWRDEHPGGDYSASEQGAGRWTLKHELGEGGGGVVVLADDRHLGRVALKMSRTDGEARKFKRESLMLKRGAHENVCLCHDAFPSPDNTLFCMVMEYLEGQSLQQVLDAAAPDEQGRHWIRESEALRYCSQILDALAHVHGKSIIHRDLKPSNIMIVAKPDGSKLVKLIDFGIAVAARGGADRGLATTLITAKESIDAAIGTPHYMSSEQLEAGAVDSRTDLYSLAVVLFRCLSGELPFGDKVESKIRIASCVLEKEAQDLSELTKHRIGEKLASFVSKGLAKNPADRFQTASEMQRELNEALKLSPDQRFDVFLNYRVWCESDLCTELFHALSRRRIGSGRGKRMMVYLDKVRLLDGQRFDKGFVMGLAKSSVFVALMSENALSGFPFVVNEFNPEGNDKEDFVLLEYVIAIVLLKRGVLKNIFPIIIGAATEHGEITDQFFQSLRSGKISSGRSRSARSVDMPDRVSVLTMSKAREFLALVPESLGGPVVIDAEEAQWSVKAVLDQMIKYQSILLHMDCTWQKPDESEAAGDESDESEPELTRTISIASSHGDTMPAKLSRKDMNQKSVIEHCTDRIANVAATSGSDGGLRRAESMAVAEGCLVRIEGLTSEKARSEGLNGKYATVVEHDAAKKHYLVQLRGEQRQLRLPIDRVVQVDEADAASAAPAAVAPPASGGAKESVQEVTRPVPIGLTQKTCRQGMEVTVFPREIAGPLFAPSRARWNSNVERNCGSSGRVIECDLDGTAKVRVSGTTLWYPYAALFDARAAVGDARVRDFPNDARVGDRVKIRADVSEPVHGWGSITHSSVGTVKSLTDFKLEVDFPEQREWRGKRSEFELVSSAPVAISARRRLTIGDRVRLAPGFEQLGCLADGGVGTIEEDDHDHQPYNVRCNATGNAFYYKEKQVVDASETAAHSASDPAAGAATFAIEGCGSSAIDGKYSQTHLEGYSGAAAFRKAGTDMVMYRWQQKHWVVAKLSRSSPDFANVARWIYSVDAGKPPSQTPPETPWTRGEGASEYGSFEDGLFEDLQLHTTVKQHEYVAPTPDRINYASEWVKFTKDSRVFYQQMKTGEPSLTAPEEGIRAERRAEDDEDNATAFERMMDNLTGSGGDAFAREHRKADSPPPPTAAASTSSASSKYDQELSQLLAMGFEDVGKVKELLEITRGDVQQTVALLSSLATDDKQGLRESFAGMTDAMERSRLDVTDGVDSAAAAAVNLDDTTGSLPTELRSTSNLPSPFLRFLAALGLDHHAEGFARVGLDLMGDLEDADDEVLVEVGLREPERAAFLACAGAEDPLAAARARQ